MMLSRIVKGFSKTAARFARNERGNVAIMACVTAPALLLALGAAIDYSRAANARSAMQAAVDATALMVSKEAATMSSSDLEKRAQAYFAELYKRSDVTTQPIKVSYSANTGSGASVVITAEGKMQADLMPMSGGMPINVTSTTKWGNMRYRVALALDTTGSMNSDDKIGQLKIATKKLIEDFYAMAASKDDVYISIVPFAKAVNIGTNNVNASWVRWDKLAGETHIDTAWEAEPPVMANWIANNTNTWERTGPGSNCPLTSSTHGFRCATSPTSTTTTSTVPSSGTYSGYICPSNDTGNVAEFRSGIAYNGCYTSDQTTVQTTGSSATCPSGWNTSGWPSCSCSGSGSGKVCTKRFYTHVWRKTGTASAPSRSTWNGCVADRDKDHDISNTAPAVGVRSTMVHAEQYNYCGESMLGMTSVKDGKATLTNKVDAMFPNGSTNQGIGLAWAWLTHATDGPFPAPSKDNNNSYIDVIILLTDGMNTQNRYSGNGSNHAVAIDDRQALLCTKVKDSGIKIFAVQVATGGDPQSNMLKNCTSEPNNPNYFSYITTASQMTVKFQNIFKELSKLRVAS